jgi:hypothetical protein
MKNKEVMKGTFPSSRENLKMNPILFKIRMKMIKRLVNRIKNERNSVNIQK